MSRRHAVRSRPEEAAAAGMTIERAQLIAHRACIVKKRYRRREAMELAARRRAAGHGPMSAYRCPFGCGAWHVGHAPGLEAMIDLAAAVRVLGGNRPTSPG